jgi:hypothetical protein
MVPNRPSYFSRFALKFAEILGAGIATAVSGYLVAHVGGYLSWPMQPSAPTAGIAAAPSGGAKTAERPHGRAAAPAAVETDTHATAAHDDHVKDAAHPAVKATEGPASPTAATATTASADNDDKRARGAAPARKPAIDTHAAKPAPHETAEAKTQETAEAKAEAKAHETAEAKAHSDEAVEEQVRAALANIDASRSPAASAAPLVAASPATQTPATTAPRPLIAPATPAPVSPATSQEPPASQNAATQNAAPVAAAAPSAPVAVAAPAQQVPAAPGPLNTVEIKSLPVAGVAEASPDAPAPAQADDAPDGKAKGESDKGFFSTIAHLPDLLRANAPAPGTEPPRPPMPVGQ